MEAVFCALLLVDVERYSDFSSFLSQDAFSVQYLNARKSNKYPIQLPCEMG